MATRAFGAASAKHVASAQHPLQRRHLALTALIATDHGDRSAVHFGSAAGPEGLQSFLWYQRCLELDDGCVVSLAMASRCRLHVHGSPSFGETFRLVASHHVPGRGATSSSPKATLSAVVSGGPGGVFFVEGFDLGSFEQFACGRGNVVKLAWTT